MSNYKVNDYIEYKNEIRFAFIDLVIESDETLYQLSNGDVKSETDIRKVDTGVFYKGKRIPAKNLREKWLRINGDIYYVIYAEDEEFYTNNTYDFPCYIKYTDVETIEDVDVPDFNVGDQVIYNAEFEEDSGVYTIVAKDTDLQYAYDIGGTNVSPYEIELVNY
jgi:hypothetical protein